MTTTVVYVVRHGETDANRQEIIQGHLDTHLNEAGLAQAELVASALKDVAFDIAFTSDLSRAARTTEAIMAHHSGVPVRSQAALRERHLGVLQGKTYSEKRAANIDKDPTAEPNDVFLERTLGWWNSELVIEARRVEARGVLVVSHGGFINTLVKGLIQRHHMSSDIARAEGPLWKCWNCSITTIELDLEKGTAILIKYGATEHLDGFKMVESNVDVQVEERNSL